MHINKIETGLEALKTAIKNKDIEIANLSNMSLFSKILFINNFLTNSKANEGVVIDSLYISQKNVDKMFDTKAKRIHYMKQISDLYSKILYDEVYETSESILFDYCNLERYGTEDFINSLFYITLNFTKKLNTF